MYLPAICLPRGMGSPLIFEPMPRYYPNTRFSDCWSSVGNVTFYHRDGKCYWRKKSTLKFAGTPAQLSTLEVHRRALAAWRSLDHQVQLDWNGFAARVHPRRPPFGTHGCITGHNLFISAYHGFCTLGDEHIPAPVEYGPFPDFILGFVSAVPDGSAGLRIRCRLVMPGCSNPGRYAILGKIQLTRAGAGCNPGLMKNVLADVAFTTGAGPGLAEFFIHDYRTFCGLDSDRYSLHMRYLLIDRDTGYRCHWKKLTAVFSII